jgi:TolB protein
MNSLRRYFPLIFSLMVMALGFLASSLFVNENPLAQSRTDTFKPPLNAAKSQFTAEFALTQQAVMLQAQDAPNDTSPSWSPDGQWIAFISNRDSPRDIYVMRPDGSNKTLARSDPGAIDAVRWSPDSGWVVFYSFADYAGYSLSNIYRIHPNGASQQNLSFGARFGERTPDISPDGEWVTFVSYYQIQALPPYAEVYRMRADGSERQLLTGSPNPYTSPIKANPTWSPDGQWIAYEVSGFSLGSEIFRMRPDGSDQQQLTGIGGSNPVWSPDGGWIAFEANGDIFRMRPNGTLVQQLTQHPALDTQPQWSPDGQYITFTSERDNDREVYLMRADGSERINLTANRSQDESAIWSPDGQWIAFASDRNGDWDIFRMRLNGTELINLTAEISDEG